MGKFGVSMLSDSAEETTAESEPDTEIGECDCPRICGEVIAERFAFGVSVVALVDIVFDSSDEGFRLLLSVVVAAASCDKFCEVVSITFCLIYAQY